MSLEETQEWFANVLTAPVFSATDTARWIKPNRRLAAFERLRIYHEQYWWRLLKTLNAHFPFVRCLFGDEQFTKQIAMPYLRTNPPMHWALCKLGEGLSSWLQETYTATDKPLVVNAARIDWAAHEAFWIPQLPPPDFSRLSQEEILTTAWILQPHLHLFDFQGDMFSLRAAFLEKKAEFWSDNPFPAFEIKKCFFILYRSPEGQVAWRELSAGAYQMLLFLKGGLTIQEACAKMEAVGGDAAQEAQAALPFWFRDWTYLRLFATPRKG